MSALLLSVCFFACVRRPPPCYLESAWQSTWMTSCFGTRRMRRSRGNVSAKKHSEQAEVIVRYGSVETLMLPLTRPASETTPPEAPKQDSKITLGGQTGEQTSPSSARKRPVLSSGLSSGRWRADFTEFSIQGMFGNSYWGLLGCSHAFTSFL